MEPERGIEPRTYTYESLNPPLFWLMIESSPEARAEVRPTSDVVA